MPINTALLKYGYNNFSFTVLEFCSVDNIMSREKHYFEIYSPEYNILKTPGSPNRGSGWKHSEATIENMRSIAIERSKSPEYLNKLSEAQSSGIKIEVTDLETNTLTPYSSISAAGRALGIDKRYIEHFIYLDRDIPVLGRYTFKLITLDAIKDNKINKNIQKTSQEVEVTNNETKEITVYPSVGAAARALGYRQPSISLYLKENRVKPFKGKYFIRYTSDIDKS